jgi:hypothetical protein
MLAETLKEIETVRCVYSIDGLGRVRVGEYTRSGVRYRQASANATTTADLRDVGSLDVVQPMESTFDGAKYFQRRRVNELGVSDQNAGGLVAMSTPEDFVLSISGGPLGLPTVLGLPRTTMGGGTFDLVSAEVIREGPDLGRVKLKWSNQTTRLEILAVHDLDLGGWPIRATETDSSGKVLRELLEVRYTEKRQGVPPFPIEATFDVSRAEGGVQRQILRVETSGLRINEGVDDSEFRLEPQPNDVVKRIGRTEVLRAAVDEGWKPAGVIRFPWRSAWEQHLRIMPPEPGLGGPKQALTGAGATEKESLDGAIGPEAGGGRDWSVGLLVAGAMAAAAGGILIIRGRVARG